MFQVFKELNGLLHLLMIVQG